MQSIVFLLNTCMLNTFFSTESNNHNITYQLTNTLTQQKPVKQLKGEEGKHPEEQSGKSDKQHNATRVVTVKYNNQK